MLRVLTPDGLVAVPNGDLAAGLPAGTVWIDLLDPTAAEEAVVEAATGIGVPTREDLDEIESSSRLYTDNGTIYITATLATGLITEEPETVAVSFVLTSRHVVTVRYAQIRAFDRFAAHAGRSPLLCASPAAGLVHLLEAIVDRLADGTEHVGRELDSISRQAFRRARGRERQRIANIALKQLLVRLGAAQDALAKARESAASLRRAVGFLAFAMPRDAGQAAGLKTLIRDVESIADHAAGLAGNLNFLLDAALGLINIEQNAALKVFSVATIMLMPPTLVAGIYGMNFEHMPELGWRIGYPMALAIMLLSAVLPFALFRWRGWL